MKRLFLSIIIIFFATISFSQNKYWVFFSDKDDCSFNPYEYFCQKAIDRRIKHGIDLYDVSDFPVNQNYISETEKLVDSINVITRWFNGVSVYANENQIEEVKNLPFVREIRPIKSFGIMAECQNTTSSSVSDRTLLAQEMRAFGANVFKDNKIDGSGVRIAIFDGGFPGVDKLKAFEHIRKENRIIATYDFQKKTENVYRFNSHGTNVMSCIAGKIDDMQLGMATGAEFLLARTEIAREIFVEEENWLAAVEWADKNGADIISSSLGYTEPRYTQKTMDGKTTLVSQAAKKASDKGILVINAMGNDGGSKWKLVSSPADVEEVLSVGGVKPSTNLHINFSSYGPTADFRMKPNVCAAGHVLVASHRGGVRQSDGTSFSTPLVAGFAACALQTDNSMTNMQLKENIEKSASLYPYFDYAHGFGIPQAKYFFNKSYKSNPKTSFTVKKYDNKIQIDFNLSNEDFDNEKVYFYYKFSKKNKVIHNYSVVRIYEKHMQIQIPITDEELIFQGFLNDYFLEYKLNN